MLALDTSAIVALEAEASAFADLIARHGASVGAPTLVEARLVLERISADPLADLRAFLQRTDATVHPFDAAMFEVALGAFARFGKGRGHPARLNFGDCLSYAVADTLGLPLLFKGADFTHTDIRPAHTTAP